MSSHMLEDDESNWANLPDDLQEKVMETLHCRDTLALCKSSKNKKNQKMVLYFACSIVVVADGFASKRSSGICSPETSHTPYVPA